MSKSRKCCRKMADTLKEWFARYLHIGEGECSGTVCVDDGGVHVHDGWAFSSHIEFRFCPFCGTKRN